MTTSIPVSMLTMRSSSYNRLFFFNRLSELLMAINLQTASYFGEFLSLIWRFAHVLIPEAVFCLSFNLFLVQFLPYLRVYNQSKVRFVLRK